MSIEDIAWLTGRWKSDRFDALYSTPEGGMILSSWKWFQDGQLTYFEFERFFERDGSLLLVPYPAGVASVEFPCTGAEPSTPRAVFHNPNHDFPTQFTYELTTPDTLRVTLSGPDGKGGKKSIIFELVRDR